MRRCNNRVGLVGSTSFSESIPDADLAAQCSPLRETSRDYLISDQILSLKVTEIKVLSAYRASKTLPRPLLWGTYLVPGIEEWSRELKLKFWVLSQPLNLQLSGLAAARTVRRVLSYSLRMYTPLQPLYNTVPEGTLYQVTS